MAKISPNDDCPCHSGKKYKKCCRAYHENKINAPTPEALVRSRFSAYTLGFVAYIMDTTHPEGDSYNPKANRWQAELEAYCLRNYFMDLKVLSADGDNVSYQANILQFGVEERTYIEHANFEQVDGRWLYKDGEIVDVEPDEVADEAETSAEETGEA